MHVQTRRDNVSEGESGWSLQLGICLLSAKLCLGEGEGVPAGV